MFLIHNLTHNFHLNQPWLEKVRSKIFFKKLTFVGFKVYLQIISLSLEPFLINCIPLSIDANGG